MYDDEIDEGVIVTMIDGWLCLLGDVIRRSNPQFINKNTWYMWGVRPMKKILENLKDHLRENNVTVIGFTDV